MDTCGDHLMEDTWEEGFTCALPAGHDGPHRDMTDVNEVNIGTDQRGRRYGWVYEWEYI